MEAKHAVSFMTCTQNVAPDTFRTIPPEASIPIPVKSDVVMMHGHHKGELCAEHNVTNDFVFSVFFCVLFDSMVTISNHLYFLHSYNCICTHILIPFFFHILSLLSDMTP
jgi:hypothetical protein